MGMEIEIEGVTFNYDGGEVEDVSISYSAKSTKGTRYARSYGAPAVPMEDYAANSDLPALKQLIVDKLTEEWRETDVNDSTDDGDNDDEEEEGEDSPEDDDENDEEDDE